MKPRQPTPHELTLIEDTFLSARLIRPYYARALRTLTPYVADEGMPTVAVGEGWQIYFGREWLESTPVQTRGLIVAAHEVEHLLRRHASRRMTREPKAWNICGDAEINDDDPALLAIPDCVTPKVLNAKDGLTAEEYYENLEKVVHECQCGSGAGQPIDGEEPGGLTDHEGNSVAAATAADVRAHVAAHGRGSVPEGVIMWADTVAAAVQPSWPRELLTHVAHGVQNRKGKQDYSRGLHRRQRANAPLRPATVTHPPRVSVVVDTSGSMTEDGPVVLGVLGVLRRLCNPTVMSCDTVVHVGKKLVGGGGTDLRPAIALAEKSSDVIVVITDGDTPWPKSVTKPVVVVCTQERELPPWAHKVKV